ncbi:MAG: tyrosine-type recombinase/integrase [Bacillota bacterium]|nr:tyrosine-type recombinase/integrase [Bacillota bacterium]
MPCLRLKKRDNQEKTIKELFDEFLLNLKSNQRSRWTIKTYTEKINSFLRYVPSGTLCKDITQKTIENYMQELLKTNRETSVNTHLTHLKTIFNYATEKGYMKQIKINKISAQEKQKRVYSKEDLEELLREEPRESFMRYQARIIIATFVSTGLRLSELISLQVRDIDFNNLIIYSRHTKTKKNRLLPISTSLKVLLIEWLTYRKYENEEDTLFCNSYAKPLNTNTLQTLIRRYCIHKKVGDKSIHQFRRTFITHAVNKNVDIISLSRITGHTNLKTLNKYYVNDAERVASLADRVSILESIDLCINRKRRIRK